MIKRIVAAAEIRADILDTAKHYVLKDRNATHGDPEDNFGRIAELWAAYKRVPFNATDVAAMMALMKVARIAQSPEHRDSWIDLAGYAACGAGIALLTSPEVAEELGNPEGCDGADPRAYYDTVEAFRKARTHGAGIASQPPEDENPCIPAAKDTQNRDYDKVVKSLAKENVKRLPDKATRK